MQNGSDPEATCRTKRGEVCRGYAANVVEAVGEHGTAIIDWQCGQNIKSDGQCLQESIANSLEQEEGRIVVADGAYGGEENRDLEAAIGQRVVLCTTKHLAKEHSPCNDWDQRRARE